MWGQWVLDYVLGLEPEKTDLLEKDQDFPYADQGYG